MPAPWQGVLRVKPQTPDPTGQRPVGNNMRIDVTPPDDPDHILWTTTVVASTDPSKIVEVSIPCGDATLPPGDYAVRLRYINTALGSVSCESSTWFPVHAPAPDSPELAEMPFTRLATPTPTPDPTPAPIPSR